MCSYRDAMYEDVTTYELLSITQIQTTFSKETPIEASCILLIQFNSVGYFAFEIKEKFIQ